MTANAVKAQQEACDAADAAAEAFRAAVRSGAPGAIEYQAWKQAAHLAAIADVRPLNEAQRACRQREEQASHLFRDAGNLGRRRGAGVSRDHGSWSDGEWEAVKAKQEDWKRRAAAYLGVDEDQVTEVNGDIITWPDRPVMSDYPQRWPYQPQDYHAELLKAASAASGTPGR